MQDELMQFFESPDRETYLAMRALLVASQYYDPYSDEIHTAGELYEQNRLEEARDTLQNSMGNLILSPGAHQLLGFLHHELGNERASQMEVLLAHACMRGILASGDGSANSPYIVARTSDEHDVVECLDKQLKRQSLMNRDGKHLDLLECTDGSEYWFDITDAYNHLHKLFGE